MKTGPLNGSITTYTLVSASANKEDIRTARLNTLTMKIYLCYEDGIECPRVYRFQYKRNQIVFFPSTLD